MILQTNSRKTSKETRNYSACIQTYLALVTSSTLTARCAGYLDVLRVQANDLDGGMC